MLILGFSGFESLTADRFRHAYSFPFKRPDELLEFSGDHIPLQFFPLSLIGHDSSAALIKDGSLVAFAAEERFSRVKHGFNLAGQTVLPRHAIQYCLQEAGAAWKDLDYIGHYCHFTKASVSGRLKSVAQNLDDEQMSILREEYGKAYASRLSKAVLLRQIEILAGRPIAEKRLIQVPHHLAHAAGTFYSSPFEEALLFTIDGYGEEESTLLAEGRGNAISARSSVRLPHSLGLLYQIITAYLGFRSFGDEYKVMGLSAYGDPGRYQSVFNRWVRLLPDGTFQVEGLSTPDLAKSLKAAFGMIEPPGEFSVKAADIAAALQKTLELAILHMLSHSRKKYPQKSCCLAGGVALNACANGALKRSGLFENCFIQPAASDEGGSLGAALYVWHDVLRRERATPVEHAFWGPGYTGREVERALQKEAALIWKKEPHIEDVTAELLTEGKIMGWFQGRLEMGPRALGGRSILADPRTTEIRDRLNKLIKNREMFRPFAASVLDEKAADYFDIPAQTKSPFMLVTFNAHSAMRSRIAGVVHADGSCRIQTVSAQHAPRYHNLLSQFFLKTGIPMLLNTSFNRAGEPVVCSPEDAVRCFLASGLDGLAIEDYLVFRRAKP